MLKLVFNPLIYALRMKHIRKSVFYCLRTTCLSFCFRHIKTASSATNLTTNNRIITSNLEQKQGRNNSHTVLSRTNSDPTNHRYTISSKKPACGIRTIEENVDARTQEESIQLIETTRIQLRHQLQSSSFNEFWDSDSDD